MEPNKKIETKKAGKKPMGYQEREARQKMLENETIEARTKRVINPRLKTILTKLDTLISITHSPRYIFTQEQTKNIVSEFEKRTIALRTSFEKTQKQEIKDIL
jgi:hypothetical protein